MVGEQALGGEPQADSEMTDALDEIALLLEQLTTFEAAKREIAVGTTTFVALAREAADAADRLARWAHLELRLGEMALSEASRGVAPRLAVTPRGRTLQIIFGEWEAAAVRRDRAASGSSIEALAAHEVDLLRREYADLARSIRSVVTTD